MAPPAISENTNIYAKLLACMRSLDVDWKKFATEIGIQSTGNAQRKLRDCLKKDGYQLTGGKVTLLDDGENSEQTAASEKPKTGTKRKQKTDEDDGDEGHVGTISKPAKKAVKQINIETEI